jgi:hypothetical protein
LVINDDYPPPVAFDPRISTMPWLPFPGLTAEQRSVMARWLHSAADRETHRQRLATRAQDRVRHSIRANAFREIIAELIKEL